MNKIIAVDFDGTLCENAWPNIGAPKEAVIDYTSIKSKPAQKSYCGRTDVMNGWMKLWRGARNTGLSLTQ